VIMPDKDNHALYQRYFDVYRKLYPQLRSLMHELKELN
jgi:sugar (pentulose or hexulose) kinase